MPITSTAETPCPLFENSTIIQQPADFTTLAATYTNAATAFIRKNSGKITSCLSNEQKM